MHKTTYSIVLQTGFIIATPKLQRVFRKSTSEMEICISYVLLWLNPTAPDILILYDAVIYLVITLPQR